jgi:hypothetical protein
VSVKLIAALKREASARPNVESMGGSNVVTRKGRQWFAFGDTVDLGGLLSVRSRGRVRIFQWSGTRWREVGQVVSEAMGPT